MPTRHCSDVQMGRKGGALVRYLCVMVSACDDFDVR